MTKTYKAFSSPDTARLQKDVQEYKRLADTYREQRDKLQEQWDAWDYFGGEQGDDVHSQYGTVRSEDSFGITFPKTTQAALPAAAVPAAAPAATIPTVA